MCCEKKETKKPNPLIADLYYAMPRHYRITIIDAQHLQYRKKERGGKEAQIVVNNALLRKKRR